MRGRCLCCLAVVVLAACGCSSQRRAAVIGEPEHYADPNQARNPALAQEHHERAVRSIQEDDFIVAERELKAAVAADPFNGMAHNNLGVVYFRTERYYLAAWEFQYASKLMPKKAEPRNNLGMVYEAVGRSDQAERWYEEAIAIEPGDVEIAGNLARTYILRDRRDGKTRQLLTDIVMKDSRPEWIGWARENLALMGSAPSGTSLEVTPGAVKEPGDAEGLAEEQEAPLD